MCTAAFERIRDSTCSNTPSALAAIDWALLLAVSLSRVKADFSKVVYANSSAVRYVPGCLPHLLMDCLEMASAVIDIQQGKSLSQFPRLDLEALTFLFLLTVVRSQRVGAEFPSLTDISLLIFVERSFSIGYIALAYHAH